MLSYLKNLFRKKELYCCNRFCLSPLIEGKPHYDESTNEIYCSFNCEEIGRTLRKDNSAPFYGRLPIISRKKALELLAQGELKQPRKFSK